MQAVKLRRVLGCLLGLQSDGVGQCCAVHCISGPSPLAVNCKLASIRLYGCQRRINTPLQNCQVVMVFLLDQNPHAEPQFRNVSSRTGNPLPVVAQASLVLTNSLNSQEVRNGIDRNKSQRNELWLDLGG